MGFAGGSHPLRHAQASWASFRHPLGAVSPGGRYGHALTWVADYGVLLLFGGWMAGTLQLSNALWAFAPHALLPGELQLRSAAAAAAVDGAATDAIFEGVDDAGDGTWRELPTSGAPCPRYSPTLASHAGVVYVMGGYTARHEQLRDLWRLELPDFSTVASNAASTLPSVTAAALAAALASSSLHWVPMPLSYGSGPKATGAAALVNASYALVVAEATDASAVPTNMTAATECVAQCEARGDTLCAAQTCPLIECVGVRCVWTADVASGTRPIEEGEDWPETPTSPASPILDQMCVEYDAPEAPSLGKLAPGSLRNGCELPWLSGTLCRYGDPNAVPAGLEMQPPAPYLEGTTTWAGGESLQEGVLVLFGGARFNDSTNAREYTTTMWAYSPADAFAYEGQARRRARVGGAGRGEWRGGRCKRAPTHPTSDPHVFPARMFTRQVFGFKRETLRNTSSMLARATPDEALVLGESFGWVIFIVGAFLACCGCPIICVIVRVRGLAKQRKLQEELNLSRKDAAQVKAQEEQRAHLAAREKLLAERAAADAAAEA